MDPTMKQIRLEYSQPELNECDVAPDPIRQFRAWFDAAVQAGLREPNAMTLATVGAEGRPSARVLLLKDFDAEGFVFYTNYASRKGQELAGNPWATMIFWWGDLERQVRIDGTVAQVSAEESDAYFASRPPGSQIGAWVSPQSQVIAGREALVQRLADLTQQFAGQTIPRPPHWGGYRLAPVEFEFWQGRPNRLHDRLRYRLESGGAWLIERLAP